MAWYSTASDIAADSFRSRAVRARAMSAPMGRSSSRAIRSGVLSRPMRKGGLPMMVGGALHGRGASAARTGMLGRGIAPPPRAPSFAARHGKKVAAAVALGVGYHAVGTMTRGVNKSSGRPRGIYDY